MTASTRLGSSACLIMILTLVALLVPPGVAAHAELTSSDPANGASPSGPLAGPVTLQFSEALQSGSHAELLGPGGAKVADAAIDASNRARMLFTLGTPLQPGRHTVQWTSVAADKDVARGQVVFTVVAPTQVPATPTAAPATPSPTQSVTAAPSTGPTPTVAPSATSAGASASPTPAGPGSANASDAIIPIVAALILVGAVGYMLARRGRGPA